jgi:hypothetical protein
VRAARITLREAKPGGDGKTAPVGKKKMSMLAAVHRQSVPWKVHSCGQ